MTTFIQDARYAIRMLVRSPAFSLVAILTLALGIGANTAIFTVVNALLLRPLPYVDPDRLVMVWQDLRARGGPEDEWATPGNYVDWRRETAIFSRLAVITNWRPTLTGGEEPEPLVGEQVSHEYLATLGVSPVRGRDFQPQDDVPNAPRVVVIADSLWTRRFGRDPSAVGRVIPLGGEPHEIIGVLPAGFRPVVNATAEAWRPLRLNTAQPARGLVVLRVVARLRDGLELRDARSAAATLAKQLEAAHPDSNEKTGINLVPLHEQVVGDIRLGLLVLLGAVGFVLLIACANIANLLLARGSARGRELAVRVALGARRLRVVQLLLTESLVLAAIGGIAGVVLGIWAVDALVALTPAGAPRVDEISLDRTVLVFAALLTIVTGAVFGLVPALQHSRGDVSNSLKEGGRGTPGAGGRTLRRALVAIEIALALVLLTGGGLLLQTFVRLQQADLGFRPDNVLVGFVNPPRTSYRTPEQYVAFCHQILEKASALPGVETAALSSVLPLGGDSDSSFAIEGAPPPTSRSETPVTWYRLVSASYFETMGMTLKKGRLFAAGEATPSVVVNEAFGRRYFPADDPLGKRIRFDNEPWFTIIGIVGNVRARGAREEPRIEAFLPYWQQVEPGTNILLKASGSPERLVNPLKQAVYSVDRSIPVSGVRTLSSIVSDSIAGPRFFALLSMVFALLALTLAAIGIYGVMAYAVAQRTTELGVRMALGATRGELFRLVIGDGFRLTAAGIVLGLAGSAILARWLATLLFGVRPTDPVTFVLVTVTLLLVATLASIIPAHRATRVDPIAALRAE